MSAATPAVIVVRYPATHRELGRAQVLEGKTWNHPIAAGESLYVRNAEQAAAIALTP